MSNAEDYEKAKQVVFSGMQQIDLATSSVPIISSSSNTVMSASTTATNRMMSFKSTLMRTTNEKPPPPLSCQPLSIDLETAAFLNLIRENQSTGFESFWKNNSRTLPRLSQLVRRYNVTLATSVYLEQTFSVAGAIKTTRRTSMSSVVLRSLMILKKRQNIEKLRQFVHQI